MELQYNKFLMLVHKVPLHDFWLMWCAKVQLELLGKSFLSDTQKLTTI